MRSRIFVFVFAILRIKPTALCVLGKHCYHYSQPKQGLYIVLKHVPTNDNSSITKGKNSIYAMEKIGKTLKQLIESNITNNGTNRSHVPFERMFCEDSNFMIFLPKMKNLN